MGERVCALEKDGVSETLGGEVEVSESQVEELLVGMLMDEPLGL